MKIVLGLGNPGVGYAHTYHNMGFLAAECLAEMLSAQFSKKRAGALCAHAEYNGKAVLIAKPQNFMNRSGEAAQKLLNFYKLPSSDLIVLYDDIDIEKGKIRFRMSGSAGTHNGMRDIVWRLGEDFKRVRIGVGRPPEGRDLASYVLGVVPKAERGLLAEAVKSAAEKVLELI
ncbi:MAG: aminoacyl-tRNA hydrolase [Firmicutes bacterium]|nr:aminoacyl-tRNA hydrolase [Bacillota bacterium]